MRAIAEVVAFGAAAVGILGLWAATATSVSVGPDRQAPSTQIEVFTFVETGLVYVDPDTSDIVWQNEQRVSRTIGKRPWRNPEPTDPEADRPWNPRRLIVGNPDHNVVAWVETAGGRRGDLVVVEADTGDVLARAPVDGPPDASVVIASVDDEAVYFAVVERNWPSPEVASDDIGVWRWAAGDEPRFGVRENTVYFNDVSAGVSAIYVSVLFKEAGRGTLTIKPGHPARTDFGGALSPDGRFWYGAETSQIVETATGHVIDLPVGEERAYGWTSADELVLTVCEPGTGECQSHRCDVGDIAGAFCAPGLRWPEAAGGGPLGLCQPYGLACGARMPNL